LAQPTAENDLIGPTLAARHAHTLAQRGARLVVRSSWRVPPRQGGGVGQGGGQTRSPRRWLSGEVAEDGGTRWSFNSDGALMNSSGRRRVPRLLRVEEGVRTRSIDR
jgi:hypothetical protein